MLCNLCLDGNGKNGSLPVGQNTEAVSTLSENTNPDVYELEGSSDDCQADQPHIEQSDIAKEQTESDNVSALSQIQSDRTTAAFYFGPGTDCYERFSDVVRNANKTSKLPSYGMNLCSFWQLIRQSPWFSDSSPCFIVPR